MINNRQGGRRRGRGTGRPQGGNPNPGNRQDNRQRGNAAQLLEKYKGLARDAQMQGDRVQTEYFLQFADHYYRVLNENRARFDEQRRHRDDYDSSDEDEDQVDQQADSGEAEGTAEADERDPRGGRSQRDYREPREAREPREPREYREERNGERRPRSRPIEAEADGGDERIAIDSLPPAISPAPEAGEERAPRRRPRRPRDPDEIAPAA